MSKDFNFDFDSKKYIIFMVIICIVFTIIVIKAFEYLPSETRNANEQRVLSSINSQQYEVPALAQNNNTENAAEENTKNKKTLNITLPKYNNTVEMEEIDAPVSMEIDAPPTEMGSAEQQTKQKELSKDEKLSTALSAARNYKKNARYVEALDEYKNVLALTTDKNEIAQCYEEIAEIYAISKRYGTALSYATKSYNMSPNSHRELLLARLYYKTGDINKATTRINNILRRDFSDDR